MDIGQSLMSVILLYVKLLAVFSAYHFCKQYAMIGREKGFFHKFTTYLSCSGGALFIGIIASTHRDKFDNFHTNPTLFATVFLALVIPSLLGVREGFSSKSSAPVTSSRPDEEW